MPLTPSRLAAVATVILMLVAGPRAAAQHGTVILRLRPGADTKAVLAAAVEHSGTDASSVRMKRALEVRGGALHSASGLDRYYVVAVPAERLDDVVRGLRRSSDVEYAGLNGRYRLHGSPADPLAIEQWAHRRIELEEAWKYTHGSDSIAIGFIDTGIDYHHPDLASSLRINRQEDDNGSGTFEPWSSDELRAGVPGDLDGIDDDGNGYVDDVIGYDFVDQTVPNVGDWSGRDGDPSDEHGHGTTIAGVMGAAAGNDIGISGVAPASPLVVLRAFDATGNAEDDDVAAAIVYAANNGVRVLNLSFGDVFYSPLMHDAIRYAVARGVVVVASAGNEGSGNPHYPSSYPEVIAVSMTDSNDLRNDLSNYGSQISVAAPGVEVLSTALDSAYRLAGGTSISAPYVSGVAALVLSLHPTWTPAEVRGVLELTADDRSPAGWDEFYGAGRLNARRAVEMPGPALLSITTPRSDDGVGADTTVRVVGSAHSVLLEAWQLFVGIGEIPTSWTALTPPMRHGRIHATLGELSTAGMPDTTLTLRLVLTQTNGRVAERRARLLLDRSAPRLVTSRIEPIWRLDERGVGITASTDDRTRLSAMIRPSASSEPYRMVWLEPERTGLVRTHHLILGSVDLELARPYDLYVIVSNAAGDTVMIGSADNPVVIVREAEAFPQRGFEAKSYALPFGFMLGDAVALIDTIDRTLALNRFDGTRFGKLVLYSWRDGQFIARDSIDDDWLPKDWGDTDGDGLRELLVQSGAATRIYEQSGPGRSVLSSQVFDDGAAVDATLRRTLGAELADVDGDGRDELIGRTDPRVEVIVNGEALPPHYFIAKDDGNGFRVIARLMNTTRPGFGSAVNQYGAPNALVDDFNGDGITDVLVGDDDADFLLYTRDVTSGAWRLAWSEENDGKGVTELLAQGDFDADGRVDVVTGYRSEINLTNRAGDYESPFWTVRVRRFDGSTFEPRVMLDERFAYVQPTDPFRAGASAGELDGRPGDELALSIFPGMYVMRWSAAGGFVPLWYRFGAVNNQPIIADLDRDGLPELGVGDGSRIGFYQFDRAAHGPDVPGGLAGWATSDSSAYIEWGGVMGAEEYGVYRGVLTNGPITFARIAITTATAFDDVGQDLPEGRLRDGTNYVYAVSAIDRDATPEEGDIAQPVIVFVHARARIATARAQTDSSIDVDMTADVREELYRAGAFEVRSAERGDAVEILSVTFGGVRSVVLHLASPQGGDSLIVRPTRLFRDAYGAPGDTLTSAGVRLPERENPDLRFIATRADLTNAGSTRVVVVSFNAPVDPVTGVMTANYTLSPETEVLPRDEAPDDAILVARIDPSDPTRVLLTIHDGYPIGALGRNYAVTIRGVRSADGRVINNGAESVVGFTVEAPDLGSLRVYPHPYSLTQDVTVMFAGLPRDARVTIMSREGRLLRSLRETEHNGGVEWDGRDEDGSPVASGVYLYQVTVRVGAETVASEIRKIAVVP